MGRDMFRPWRSAALTVLRGKGKAEKEYTVSKTSLVRKKERQGGNKRLRTRIFSKQMKFLWD